MNGRPTRSTRSQGQYAMPAGSSDEEAAGFSDAPEAPRGTTIKLRMRSTRSSNGGGHKMEEDDDDEEGENYKPVSRRGDVNKTEPTGNAYQLRLRGSSTPSSPSTSKSPRNVRNGGRSAVKVVNAVESGEQRRSSRLALAERPSSSKERHVQFARVKTNDRTPKRKTRMSKSDPDDAIMSGPSDDDDEGNSTRKSRSGRAVVATYLEDEDSSEEEVIRPSRRSAPTRTRASMDGFVVEDEDDDGEAAFGSGARKRSSNRLKRATDKMASLAAKRRQRRKSELDSDFEDNGEATMSDDEDDDDDEGEPEEGEDDSDEAGPRSYSLRRRTKKVDYRLAPPQEPVRDGFGKKIRSRSRSGPSGPSYEIEGMPSIPSLQGPNRSRARENWNNLPLSMTGKDYDKYFGTQNDDSSDDDIPASRKPGAGPAAVLGGSAAGGLLGAGGTTAGNAIGPDLGAGRDALGRMKGSTEMADIDPLGVNMQVDFGSVGGLDNHIQQLKEMVSLPLLYPEVFQRFKVTPPRGVLFHGPPGTGKTLVARALAASCSSSGQQISFFMRKGADCLSKWVGEAERQLRLLFEEAKAAQPSIIFFDEIDGLAPVRSSKQDQIHASIVSTLLALMDGMDGRGQVVVIGATNRPDSVDPALRRPGRFDREFYFPLPNREARKSIININTKEWDPPLEESFKDTLADVTKGYGGADLRALCTEAALNAIQRRYPQIYQTTERLELKPETIHVDARDFMMSVNKVVPSSARSGGSAAAPLKNHLKPLLEQAVVNATRALDRVMPQASKRNPLEEAQWEDDVPNASDGGFGRELLLQSFEQLRVFRPRFVVHGSSGLGQRYIGAALLHHLEGFHVQSLDAASLLGDSGTTMEASIVQMFNEAKRHKPSVLYIPSLSQWADTVGESARATFRSLLDGVSPSDPIMLVAICEEKFELLPRDIRSWFGFTKENRIQLSSPELHNRHAYFAELLKNATKAPSEFPDGLPRRKRVLEELPKAPPRAPRMPTAAELSAQAADDERTLNDLKFRLGPVLGELKKKFPRFRKDVYAEYNLYELSQQFDARREKNQLIVTLLYEPGSQLLQKLKEMAEQDDRSFENRLSPGTSAKPSVQAPIPAEGHTTEAVILQESSGQAQTQAQLPMETSVLDNEKADEADPASLSGLAAAMTGEFSSENPPPMDSSVDGLNRFKRDENGFFVRDLRIWLVNLEKMQKRLYYNGYLTVNDFMEDVGKIVSNAKEAEEVDEERFFRAQNLQITANHLINLYIDMEFRASCERMAARTLQRERDAREEQQRRREKQEEETRMPRGERHSSRLHGEKPTMATLSELAALERKRGRSSEGAKTPNGVEQAVDGAVEGVADDEARKRMRMDGVETVAAAPTDARMDQTDGERDGSPVGIQYNPAEGQAPVPALHGPTPPLPIPAHLNGFATDGTFKTLSNGVLSPIVRAAETPPQPSTPHPPFSYDPAQLRRLEDQLLNVTSTFNVEQLEHLRASLFSLIWDRRSEWDKSGLFTEMADVTAEIAAEVDVYNREQREADEEMSIR